MLKRDMSSPFFINLSAVLVYAVKYKKRLSLMDAPTQGLDNLGQRNAVEERRFVPPTFSGSPHIFLQHHVPKSLKMARPQRFGKSSTWPKSTPWRAKFPWCAHPASPPSSASAIVPAASTRAAAPPARRPRPHPLTPAPRGGARGAADARCGRHHLRARHGPGGRVLDRRRAPHHHGGGCVECCMRMPAAGAGTAGAGAGAWSALTRCGRVPGGAGVVWWRMRRRGWRRRGLVRRAQGRPVGKLRARYRTDGKSAAAAAARGEVGGRGAGRAGGLAAAAAAAAA